MKKWLLAMAIFAMAAVIFGGNQTILVEAQQNEYEHSDFAWSPNSRYAVYIRENGQDHLCVWDAQTRQTDCPIRATRMEDPSWSRDGRRIILAATPPNAEQGNLNLDLLLMDPDGSAESQTWLTATPDDSEWGPLFSANGRRIYYNSDELNIGSVQARTDIFSRCLPDNAATACQSPTLVMERAETLQMTGQGLLYRQLARGENPQGIYRLGDDTLLYQSQNYPRFFGMSWDGEVTAELMPRNGEFYARVSGIEGLVRVRLNGEPSSFALSPDGERLVYSLGDRFGWVYFPYFVQSATPTQTPQPTVTPVPNVTPSPTSAPDFILQDGFSSSNLSSWGNDSGVGSVENGVLRLNNTTDGFVIFPLLDRSWTNYAVQVDVRIVASSPQNTDFFLSVREGETGTYGASIDMETDAAGLTAVTNGSFESLGEVPVNLALNSWLTMRVEVEGSTITYLINGTQVITVTNTAHAQGSISFTLAPGVSAELDNLQVISLQ